MGGYRRASKEYRLQFEGDGFDGLEVTMGPLSTAEFLELSEIADQADASAKDARRMVELVASHLVSWNLEDDDGPVPPTLASLLADDIDFVLAIVKAWTGATAGVSPPLPNSLNGGGKYPEASIPMAPLSASRSN